MAVTISFSQGEINVPRRCPVTGTEEGLVGYPVYSWIFAIYFTRKIPITVWFTEEGYQQHLSAIGMVRRALYAIFTVFLYIPLFGRIFAAMLTVYVGWVFLLIRAISGPAGLVTFRNMSGIFSSSDNRLYVHDRQWAQDFCNLNPGLKPVMSVA